MCEVSQPGITLSLLKGISKKNWFRAVKPRKLLISTLSIRQKQILDQWACRAVACRNVIRSVRVGLTGNAE